MTSVSKLDSTMSVRHTHKTVKDVVSELSKKTGALLDDVEEWCKSLPENSKEYVEAQNSYEALVDLTDIIAQLYPLFADGKVKALVVHHIRRAKRNEYQSRLKNIVAILKPLHQVLKSEDNEFYANLVESALNTAEVIQFP